MNDYWTGDLFGLYGMLPARNGELPPDERWTGNIIKLIEPSVAGADGLSNTRAYGKVTVSDSVIVGSPKAGYVYRAFESDGEVGLRNDTDGDGLYGPVHDTRRYGFMAFPETPSTGNILFIMNPDGIWTRRLPPQYAATYTPLEEGRDSTSTVSTGHADLDNARRFPASPRAAGCSPLED